MPTGGNLTGTILTYILGNGNVDFHECSDLWINVDGVGDNICYTLQYYFAYVLMCGRKNGWTLERIHLLRMKVGHTYTCTHEHDTHTYTHIHDTYIHTQKNHMHTHTQTNIHTYIHTCMHVCIHIYTRTHLHTYT